MSNHNRLVNKGLHTTSSRWIQRCNGASELANLDEGSVPLENFESIEARLFQC